MLYSDILRSRLGEIEQQRLEMSMSIVPATFIPTGLHELDKRGGTKRGVLTIFGAATGEGKSMLKLHLMTAAAKAGHKVLVIDLEDPPERTADRTLSTITAINNAKIASLDLTDKEEKQLGQATKEACEWADNIEVAEGLSTADEAMEVIEGSDAEAVYIDYLQGFPDGSEGLERTIAALCWNANKWAQEHKAGVVAFSQIRSAVEERGLRTNESAMRRNPGAPPDVSGFRPFGASDLAWCSAAGQRCKELGFLFRPGRYKKRFGDDAKDDILELSFPKRNWGEEGTARIGFDGKRAALFDLPKAEKDSK